MDQALVDQISAFEDKLNLLNQQIEAQRDIKEKQKNFFKQQDAQIKIDKLDKEVVIRTNALVSDLRKARLAEQKKFNEVKNKSASLHGVDKQKAKREALLQQKAVLEIELLLAIAQGQDPKALQGNLTRLEQRIELVERRLQPEVILPAHLQEAEFENAKEMQGRLEQFIMDNTQKLESMIKALEKNTDPNKLKALEADVREQQRMLSESFVTYYSVAKDEVMRDIDQTQAAPDSTEWQDLMARLDSANNNLGFYMAQQKNLNQLIALQQQFGQAVRTVSQQINSKQNVPLETYLQLKIAENEMDNLELQIDSNAMLFNVLQNPTPDNLTQLGKLIDDDNKDRVQVFLAEWAAHPNIQTVKTAVDQAVGLSIQGQLEKIELMQEQIAQTQGDIAERRAGLAEAKHLDFVKQDSQGQQWLLKKEIELLVDEKQLLQQQIELAHLKDEPDTSLVAQLQDVQQDLMQYQHQQLVGQIHIKDERVDSAEVAEDEGVKEPESPEQLLAKKQALESETDASSNEIDKFQKTIESISIELSLASANAEAFGKMLGRLEQERQELIQAFDMEGISAKSDEIVYANQCVALNDYLTDNLVQNLQYHQQYLELKQQDPSAYQQLAALKSSIDDIKQKSKTDTVLAQLAFDPSESHQQAFIELEHEDNRVQQAIAQFKQNFGNSFDLAMIDTLQKQVRAALTSSDPKKARYLSPEPERKSILHQQQSGLSQPNQTKVTEQVPSEHKKPKL